MMRAAVGSRQALRISPKRRSIIGIVILSLVASILRVGGILNFTADSNKQMIRHDPDNFKHLYNYWRTTCAYGDNNAVPTRTDGFNCNDQPLIRQWSLTSDDMQAFVGYGGRGSSSFRGPLQLCETLDDLVQSAAQPMSQAKCLASWYSAESICRIQEKYSAIIWHGDSLVRHMVNAMFALLTENLRFGAYPLQGDFLGKYSAMFKRCGCDGQFSEAELCRSYDQKRLSYQTVHEIGACAHLPDLKPTPFYFNNHMKKEHFDSSGKSFIPPEQLCTANNDGRPVLIFISGGSHLHFNSHATITMLIDPLISQIKRLRANGGCVVNATSSSSTSERSSTFATTSAMGSSGCRNESRKVFTYRVVFLGVPVVNASVVEKYPSQSPDAALHFNSVIKARLRKIAPEVTVLDFWNLTKGAVARTSDGFHSLMDVNIMKVMTLINVMNLAVK